MTSPKRTKTWTYWLTLYLLMLAVLVAAGIAIYFTRPKVQSGRFVILQLNDVYRIEGIEHGSIGSLARVRTIRRHLEKEGYPVLMLHAGDFLYPSVMSKYLQARPMIQILNRLDGRPGTFDSNLIATFGNHEFERPEILLDRIRESEFFWVSSNVRYQSNDGVPEPLSRRFPQVHDVILSDIGGVRVGIFGITCNAQEAKGVSYNYEEENMRDEIVRGAISRLEEQGAGVIIALTHQDLEEDLRIAKAFPKINLVVGGHEHSFLKRRVGGTLITKADADARSVIRIDVQVSSDGTVSAQPEKIDVGSAIQPDDGVNESTNEWIGELAKAVKEKTHKELSGVVGSTENELAGVETAIRTRETALGDFLADTMRTKTQAEVAFLNGGSIRINDNIPKNTDITNYDLEGIFYYDSDVVTFKLTGAQLLELLRRSVSQVDRGHGRFLQISGIRFVYHVEGSKEAPEYQVLADDVRVLPAGTPEGSPTESYLPLNLKKSYKVATVRNLWENGYKDGYDLFSAGKRPDRDPASSESKLDLRKLTEETLAALPGRRITTKESGRIIRQEAPAHSR